MIRELQAVNYAFKFHYYCRSKISNNLYGTRLIEMKNNAVKWYRKIKIVFLLMFYLNLFPTTINNDNKK